MKKTILAATAALAAACAAPAFAQTTPTTATGEPVGMFQYNGGHASLGYTYVYDDADIGAVTGRLGARLGGYLGLEAEGSIGVDSDRTNFGGVSVKTKLRNQVAGYAVAFVPVNPNIDVFGRVGYGTQQFRSSALGVSAKDRVESVNFGGGVQYSFGQNAVRGEFTRYDFDESAGHADSVALSFVRSF